MSKKQVNSRLKNLFDGLTPEEIKPKVSQRGTKRPPITEEASTPAQQQAGKDAKTRPAPMLQSQVLTDTKRKAGDGAQLTLAFPFDAQTWATLQILDKDTDRQWDEEEKLLVKQVADQLSLALENARLFQQTQRQANELAILNEMGRELSAELDINAACETIHKFTSQLMDAADFFIALYNEKENRIEFPYATTNHVRYSPPGRPLGKGLTDYILRTRNPLFIAENVLDAVKELGLEIILVGNNKPALCWMGVPLAVGERVVGAIVLQSTERPRVYDEHQFELLRTIASQAAISLENARLFEAEQRRAQELNTLVELSRLISQNLNLEDVYSTAHRIISRILPADAFLISLHEPGTNVFINAYDIDNGTRLEPQYYDVKTGFTGYVLSLGHAYIAYDLEKEPLPFQRVADADKNYKAPRSVIATPLRFSGEIIGVLSAQSYQPNAYTQDDLRLLESFADTVAIGIQNARLFEQTRLRAEEMSVLNDLGQALSSQLDAQDVLNETYRGVARLMNATNFFIGIYDKTTHRVHYPVNVTESEIDRTIVSLSANEGMTGYIFRTRKPLLLKQNVDQWLKENKINIIGEVPKSWLGVPLMVGDEFLGLMAVQDLKEENAYDEHDSNLLMAFGNQAAIALQNALLFEQMRKRAEIERLTSEISTIFASIDPMQVSAGIDQALEKLGNFSSVDRAYVFLIDPRGEFMSCTNEWCSSNASPQIENLQNIPIGTFPFLIERLRKGQHFYFPKVADIPKEGRAEQLEFERENIQSIICSPLMERGNLIGFLGFDAVQAPRTWSEEEQNLLKFTGEAIVTALGRQQAVEALSKSEAELRALFSAMTDVIIVYDKDGRYVRVAPTNPNRLYKPPEDMVGKTIQEVLPPETHEPFMQTIHKALSTGETTSIEYPLEINGTEYWFYATVTKLNDDQVFWVSRDITERKQAEEAIRRQNEYLATAAEVGRLITSTLDLNLLFKRAVNLIRERFGFYHAAIFIVEETGFTAVLKEATGDAGEEMKKRQHALTVGSKSIVGMVTSTGEPVIINNTALDPLHRPNPLLPETRAEAGIPLRVGNRVIGALDIQSTEVDAFTPENAAVLQILADQIAVAIDNARSYELAQQAVKEMREVDRLKSQFLANMSHELRTPLNSIIGFSRVILKGIDGPISELQQQDLTAIYNSGQHLLGLINDILDLSRIEAGKMELTFDEMNLNDTINSVLSTITGLIKDKPITLKKIIPEELPPVRADAMRIRQVLLNLLSNAAKFTEQGTITLEAGVKAGPSGRPEIMISVTDSGPGIAPEDQAKLFQPFSQVDSSPTRKTGGSGLGLSISQHLVQMHGGRIGLHSTVGKGSTFYFTLPVYRGKDETGASKGNRVVLAIDDDPQVVSLYERYLQPQGYQVIALTDPTKANERARQLKPFAITLDIMMPGYDGWQVLQDLKADPATRNIPVVICSIIEDEEKGFNLGAADYLVKPILEDDLLNALNRLNSDGSIREVLVIDDDPDDLRLIAKILSDHGRYKPILAEGGKQGWEAITTATPHAIVLDLFMDDMDGFTILERLRSEEKYREIPVVVVTGGDLTHTQREQLNAFGQRLLQKGLLKEDELLSALENALRRVQT